MKKMEKLAITTASEGEINFNEILAVLKIKRSTLRNWLRSEKIAYPCLFAEGGGNHGFDSRLGFKAGVFLTARAENPASAKDMATKKGRKTLSS